MEISNRFGLLEDKMIEPEKEFKTFKININEAAKMIDDIREAKIRMENAKTRMSRKEEIK